MASFADEVFSLFLGSNEHTIEEGIHTVSQVCLLQAYWRGTIVRTRFTMVWKAAIAIQKNYRRKCAVERTRKLFDVVMYRRRHDFFAQKACLIQAAFRGFYIRKYVLDIEERQRYLAAVAAVSASVADEARQYNKRCGEQLALEEEMRKIKYISSLGNKHYLVSTKEIPGVYGSRHLSLKKKIDERPVDDLLKQEGRKLARSRVLAVTQSRANQLPSLGSLPSPLPQAGTSTTATSKSPYSRVQKGEEEGVQVPNRNPSKMLRAL